jgi:aspartate carbamoyltransferase regulatory subunit
MKVKRIENGTVIDHISKGQALNVLKVLGIFKHMPASSVTVAINVPSKLLGSKDIVKIENRELKEDEVGKIALISPDATINIIRNCKVVKKKKVSIPDIILGVIRCSNINCIANSEKVQTKFYVEKKEPLKLRCHHCERVMRQEDIIKSFEG